MYSCCLIVALCTNGFSDCVPIPSVFVDLMDVDISLSLGFVLFGEGEIWYMGGVNVCCV